MNKYLVFVRAWWRIDPITGKREPNPRARKTTLGYASTYDEAVEMCDRYNSTHKPGPTSRKAEFTSDF